MSLASHGQSKKGWGSGCRLLATAAGGMCLRRPLALSIVLGLRLPRAHPGQALQDEGV